MNNNWTTIDQITFEDLVGKTAPATVSAPAQDTSYQPDPDNVAQYISVTAEALSRFYSGIFLIRKVFEGQEGCPETAGLMEVMIKEKLIKPLATIYSEFENFDFEINAERMSIIGKSDTANTILNAMMEIARTPVDFHEDGLPEHKRVTAAMEQVESDHDESWDDEGGHDW